MYVKEGSSASLDKYRSYQHIESESIVCHEPVDEFEIKAVKKIRREVIFQNLLFLLLFGLTFIFSIYGIVVDKNPAIFIWTLITFVFAVMFAISIVKIIKFQPLVAQAKCVSPNYIIEGSGRHSKTVHYVTVVFEDEKKICDVITAKKSFEWMEEGDDIYIVRASASQEIGILKAFVEKK